MEFRAAVQIPRAVWPWPEVAMREYDAPAPPQGLTDSADDTDVLMDDPERNQGVLNARRM